MFTIIGIILVVGLCMWIGIVAVEFAFFFSHLYQSIVY